MQGANALVNQWKICTSRTGSVEDTRYASIITPIKGVRTPPHLQFSSGWKAEKKCVSGAKLVPASPSRKFTQSISAKNYSNLEEDRMDDISSIASRGSRGELMVRLLAHSGSPRAFSPRDDKGEERSRWQGWYCALCLSLRGRSVARDAAIHRVSGGRRRRVRFVY